MGRTGATFICDGCGERRPVGGSIVAPPLIGQTGIEIAPTRRYHSLDCWSEHDDPHRLLEPSRD
jgi:hypothetical protein